MTTLYFFIDVKYQPIYIGKTDNRFLDRFHSHQFSNLTLLKTKTILTVSAPIELEKPLIGYYKPVCNKQHIQYTPTIKEIEKIVNLNWNKFDSDEEYKIDEIPFSLYSVIDRIKSKGLETVKQKFASLIKTGFTQILNDEIEKVEKREREKEEQMENTIALFRMRVSVETKNKFKIFRKNYRKKKWTSIYVNLL